MHKIIRHYSVVFPTPDLQRLRFLINANSGELKGIVLQIAMYA